MGVGKWQMANGKDLLHFSGYFELFEVFLSDWRVLKANMVFGH